MPVSRHRAVMQLKQHLYTVTVRSIYPDPHAVHSATNAQCTDGLSPESFSRTNHKSRTLHIQKKVLFSTIAQLRKSSGQDFDFTIDQITSTAMPVIVIAKALHNTHAGIPTTK